MRTPEEVARERVGDGPHVAHYCNCHEPDENDPTADYYRSQECREANKRAVASLADLIRARDAEIIRAHVDHLTADNARLRAGIEAFATDAASFGDHAPRCSDRNCLHDYSIRNQRRAAALLNPPTEGEADADA